MHCHIFAFLTMDPTSCPPNFALVMTLLLMIISPSTSSALRGVQIDMRRRDAMANLSRAELIRHAVHRSKHRLSSLTAMVSRPASRISDVEVLIQPGGDGEYIMDIQVGTPAVPFSAILDTGSDLTWTQCQPCVECFNQSTPVFYPSNSSTYSAFPCSSELCRALENHQCGLDNCMYGFQYADGSITQGILSSETFTIGVADQQISVPGVGFGCSHISHMMSEGIVGLGRGPLSLVSQLNYDKFSYCLTKFDGSEKSRLLLGNSASLNQNSSPDQIQSTPILRNPRVESLYYLSLEGITVGETRLPIAPDTFAIREDGKGGLAIDSGTTTTFLEEEAYRQVWDAFTSQISLPIAVHSSTGLDLCFAMPDDASNVTVPNLVFHFAGADMDLSLHNYMLIDNVADELCLTIMPSTAGMSILGNFQQQDMHILYDLGRETLSFVPAQCDTL